METRGAVFLVFNQDECSPVSSRSRLAADWDQLQVEVEVGCSFEQLGRQEQVSGCAGVVLRRAEAIEVLCEDVVSALEGLSCCLGQER